MSTTDFFVAALFVVIVLMAGLAFARVSAEGDSDSFFSGGGIVPWWVSGISLYMSFFSVGTFVVWGSIAYTDGFVAIGIQTTMCLAGVLIGLFIAPNWNRTNVMTAAQFISNRLGPNTRTTYTALFLISSMIGMGAMLYPMGRVVEVSTGIDVGTAILILSAFIILYAAVGGLWAVLVTDLLQFVVLSASIIIIVPLAFMQIGGVEEFVTRAPENFFNLTNSEYTWGFMLAFLIYNTVYIGGHWGYIQRYTTVPSPKDARKVAWLFAGLYSVSPLIWMLPPMIYRLMEPNLTGLENEGAYMLMSKAVLPAGILGLMLSAMVFATASSVNTVLNISAAVFTNDVYSVVKKNASQKELLNVGRISTGIFGLVAIGSAFMVDSFGGIVSMVLTISAFVGGALFLPPLWALFSRRQTAFSILTVTIVTLAVNLACKFVTPGLIGFALDRAEEMLVGVFLPLALLALFELWFALRDSVSPRHAEYERKAQELHEERAALIVQSRERKIDHRANTIIASSIISVGVIITALAAIAGSAAPIVAVAGVIVMIGGTLVLESVRARLGLSPKG